VINHEKEDAAGANTIFYYPNKQPVHRQAETEIGNMQNKHIAVLLGAATQQ
jgi:hypothetical protein